MFFVISDARSHSTDAAPVALFEIQIENDASLVTAAWLYECSPTYTPISCVCVCMITGRICSNSNFQGTHTPFM